MFIRKKVLSLHHQTIKPIKMTTEKLHEDTINKNTYIFNLRREIGNLDELIKDYNTYSDNVYIVTKLKNLSQRMKNDLKALELACDGIDDYINSNI